jgi:hypothetical protein
MSTLKHTDHVAIPLGKRGAFEALLLFPWVG